MFAASTPAAWIGRSRCRRRSRRAPGERQLPWIDIGGAIDDERLAALAERFELEPQARDTLAEPRRRPQLSMHGACVDPCVAATPGHSLTKSPIWLEIVAGRSFVITRRSNPSDGVGSIVGAGY